MALMEGAGVVCCACTFQVNRVGRASSPKLFISPLGFQALPAGIGARGEEGPGEQVRRAKRRGKAKQRDASGASVLFVNTRIEILQ